MKKILFGIFVGLFSITASFAVTISITVVDEKEQPLVGVSVYRKDDSVGGYTDGEGKLNTYFKDDNATIVISYVGYLSQEFKASELVDKKIIMKSASQAIEDVVVVGDNFVGVKDILCKRDSDLDGYDCYALTCVDDPLWALDDKTKKCNKKSDTCKVDNGTAWLVERGMNKFLGTTYYKTGDKNDLKRARFIELPNEQCEVASCDYGYKANNNNTNCIPKSGDCKEDFKEDKTYLDKAEWDKGVCRVKTCKTGYEPNKETNTCDPITNCPKRLLKLYNAEFGEYKYENGKESCYNIECNSDKYQFYGDPHNKCLQKCDVTDADKRKGIASKAMADDGVCRVMECNTPQYLLSGTAGTADAKCVNQVDTPCRFQNPPADFWDKVEKTEYIMNGTELKCVVKSCKNKDYKPNTERNDCVQVSGVCTPEDEHAIGDGMLKDGKCVIKECDTGWKVDTYNNICISRIGDPCEKEEYTRVHKYATSGTYQFRDGQETCINLTCDKNKGHKPNEDATNCVEILTKCTSEQKAAIPNAKSWGIEKGTENCIALECNCGYLLENGKCRPRTDEEKKCSKYTNPQLPKNAEKATMQCIEDKEVCVIDNDGCAEGYDLDKAKNKCVKLRGKSCVDKLVNDSNRDTTKIKTAKWEMDGGVLKCVVKDCYSDYKPNEEKTDCEWSANACPSEKLTAIKYAKSGKYDAATGKCTVTKCEGELKVDAATNACICGDLPIGVKEQKSSDTQAICYPVACKENQWKKTGEGATAQCVEQDCKFDNGKGEWQAGANGVLECKLKSCDERRGYEFNEDKTGCVKKQTECTEEQKAAILNATSWGLKKGTKDCIALACECGYKLIDGTCEEKSQEEKKCKSPNAKEAESECEDGKEVCRPKACEEEYYLYNKQCMKIDGDCDKSMLPENATMGERWFDTENKKIACRVTGCIGGYDPGKDGKSCVVNPEEQKKIAEAQAKYDLARENEQSLENRLLGATGIGTMGVGGKMVGQALAEQAADEDAERDMAAYLASFRCDYGGGRNIKGGEMGVELPGENELIPLYSEYVALANDLKLRKTQLGLKAGIESEQILDSATSGLYDDVSTGITKGTYASLARALMNPNGEDAKLWAEQKEKTSKNLTTGATVAGAGALISVAGNIAHTNEYQKKLKSIDVSQLLAALEKSINSHQGQEKQECPSTAPGTYPNCNCGDKAEFNLNSGKCDACPGNQTVHNGKCGCFEFAKPRWDAASKKCVPVQRDCVPECAEPTPSNHLFIDANCNCSCVGDYLYIRKQCLPKSLQAPNGPDLITTLNQLMLSGTELTVPGAIKALQGVSSDDEQIQSVELSAKGLFNTGSYELTNKAQNAINTFVSDLKNKVGDNYTGVCDFTVNGYTDTSGSPDFNQTLSEQRANAVWNYLQKMLDGKGIVHSGLADGYGEDGCVCVQEQLSGACDGKNAGTPVEDGTYYEPCRKVTISVSCSTSVSGEVGQ